jgi:hypothetical protein
MSYKLNGTNLAQRQLHKNLTTKIDHDTENNIKPKINGANTKHKGTKMNRRSK